MKEIKAIIQPHLLNRVMDALHGCAHFPGVTITDCQGQGRGRGKGGHFEATQDSIFFAKKVKLEIYCTDDVCDHLVGVIGKAAHSGNPGDGVIGVANVDRVSRIRTDKEQDEAV